jgi:hypothetical protein
MDFLFKVLVGLTLVLLGFIGASILSSAKEITMKACMHSYPVLMLGSWWAVFFLLKLADLL